jgi:hypothetical protein
MLVELAPDPVSKGPGYLQELISRTRGYLNRTSVFTQEAHQDHQFLERDLHAKKTVFQINSDELLANDRRVTQLPNIDDRKAFINVLLKDERQEISSLEQAIREIGFVEKAIKHRHKELDNTISAIRMQKSLIDSEGRTGSFYGDESNTSRGDVYSGRTKDPIDDMDGDDIGRLLAASLGDPSEMVAPEASLDDLCAPQQVGVVEASEPKNSGNGEEEFEKFLEGDDLDDIFSGL